MNASARIPAVRAVVFYGGKFLLARHHNHLPETMGKWGLPGGRIEASDASLIGALHRELYEEFAMTVDIIGFVAMYTYRERSHHIFLARPHNIDFVIDQNEILGITWWTLSEVERCYTDGQLHAGFEFAAIRASIARYGDLVLGGVKQPA